MFQLRLGQSAMKDISFKGVIRDEFCPRFWWMKYIKGMRTEATEAMQRGSYFEYITGVNPESEVTDLPKDQRTGKKRVAQTRLDSQALIFTKTCIERSIIVKDETVQRTVCTPWFESGFVCPECDSEKIEVIHAYAQNPNSPVYYMAYCECGNSGDACRFARVIIEGIIDIFTPFKKILKNDDGTDKVIYVPLGIIDVKVTTNIDTTYAGNEYCWGAIEEMDLIQAVAYPWIIWKNTGYILPFSYWVFDYKPDFDDMWHHTNVTELTFKEFEQTIRTVLRELRYHWKEKFIPQAVESNCKLCPEGENGDNTCKFAIRKNETETNL